jgi:hypothetical protein
MIFFVENSKTSNKKLITNIFSKAAVYKINTEKSMRNTNNDLLRKKSGKQSCA